MSEKVCSEEVLRPVGEERAIISVINRRQRVWLGHTLRHGNLIPLVIEGRIIGRCKLEDLVSVRRIAACACLYKFSARLAVLS